MKTIPKPENLLVGSVTLDTLNNVINNLSLLNEYFLQASATPSIVPEKEVWSGLGMNLDQTISALRYERELLQQSRNKDIESPRNC